MMKTLLLLLFFIVSIVSLQSQNTVKYAYDASGNRIKREILLTKSAVATTTEPEVFTDQVVERKVKIYPNPTQGQLKVEVENTEGIKNCTITITAMNTGKLITKKKATLPITDIDISNQPFGIYIMLIEIDGEYTFWKIMKN